MRGQVLSAEPAGGGMIAGSDGKRYGFGPSDWRGPVAPEAGAEVDFISGDGVAQDIFPLPGRAAGLRGMATPSATAPQNEGSSVMLGGIGILCLVLGFVVPVLPTIAALILGLIGANSAKRHGNETGLVLSRISWIGAVVLFAVGIGLLIAAVLFAWPMLDLFWQYVMSVANEQAGQTAFL